MPQKPPAAPYMTRSNSSGGVLGTTGPSSPVRTHRNRPGVSRNNSVESTNGPQQSNGLRTFRPGPATTDALRTGSPSRAAPPNLADLEFPPPPSELPPPAEQSPPAARRPPLPSSPRAARAEKTVPQVTFCSIK